MNKKMSHNDAASPLGGDKKKTRKSTVKCGRGRKGEDFWKEKQNYVIWG